MSDEGIGVLQPKGAHIHMRSGIQICIPKRSKTLLKLRLSSSATRQQYHASYRRQQYFNRALTFTKVAILSMTRCCIPCTPEDPMTRPKARMLFLVRCNELQLQSPPHSRSRKSLLALLFEVYTVHFTR